MAFFDEIRKIKSMKETGAKAPLASNHFFLEDESVLAYPRTEGDSRQPYQNDGVAVWAYGSGYIRVLDGKLSIFPEVNEGEEPRIAFFANVDGELVSLLGIPVLNEKCVKSRYTVFGTNAAYYFTELEGLTFAVRVFLSEDKEVRFSLAIFNESGKEREITLSSFFNPYLRNDGNCQMLWLRYFKESRVKDEDSITFYVTEGDKKDSDLFQLGIRQFYSEGCEVLYREQTTKRGQYNGGTNCNLNNAQVARDGKIENPMHCTAFNDFAIAGDVMRIKLSKDARIEYRFARSHDKEEMSCEKTDAMFDKINKDIKSTLSFEIEQMKGTGISPKTLSGFLRKIQYQINIGALGKDFGGGGNVGFRDIAQQIEQCLIWNSEDCRKKILVVMSHMFPDGRAPRQFSIPAPGEDSQMVIANYIDMGIWMINAIDYYLRFTGDFSILDEECGYYEIVSEDGVVKRSEKRDSLLCHMIAIVDRLVRNIADDSDCVRILFGDWNDAIDSLGNTNDPNQRFGSGVSVMATLQAYENLIMMNNIFKIIGGHEQDIAKYEAAMARIKKGFFENAIISRDGEHRVLHGWGDKRSFFVGSFCDVDGEDRISSTSHSFFAMSSMYDHEYDKDIINAFSKLDNKYGFRTFDKPFSPTLRGVGRIGKLPAGTAENAATYIHAALFAVLSLYKIGFDREATKQLLKLMPISYEKVDRTPYVMQNAYCYNPDINVDGSALNDWFTGSAPALFRAVFTYVFGIQPGYDSLKIAPAKESFLQRARVSTVIRGKKINVTAERTGSPSLTVNGSELVGNTVPYSELKDVNDIYVTC